jgi:hypothetical protein
MPVQTEATWEQIEGEAPAVETPAVERTEGGRRWTQLGIAALIAIAAVIAGVGHSIDATQAATASGAPAVSVAAVPAAK